MKKKISNLIIAFTLLILVGCNNNQQTSEETKYDKKQELTKKEEADTNEKTLNLYVYDSYNIDKYLNEAVQRFESDNPGTKINITPFSSMPDVKSSGDTQVANNDPNTKAKSDYINRVNTELMSGEGPDILAMDVLPYHRYAEGGLLEDIGEYIKNDKEFKQEDYFENILNATKYNGKQYMMPIDYSFDYIVYNKNRLGNAGQKQLSKESYTIDDLVKIGTSANETKSKFFALLSGSGLGTSMDTSTYMFPWLLNMNYNNFVNIAEKKSNFDDGQFAQLLETVNDYTSKGYIYPLSDQDKFMGAEAPESTFRLLNDSLFYQSLYPKMPLYGSINSSVGFPSPDEVVTGVLKSNDEKVSFSYLAQSYAINKNSKNKELAWKFIKFLASEDMQSSTNLIARPINIKALENQSVYTVTGRTSKEIQIDSLPIEYQSVYKNYVEKQKKYIGAINSYTMRDAVVDYLIQKETKDYFDGKKTVEQTVANLQEKVQRYLNE